LRARSPMGVIRRSLECWKLRGGINGGLGNLSMFALSCDTPYYIQQDEWSCGYRNYQMLFGGLVMMNHYSKWKPPDEDLEGESSARNVQRSLQSDSGTEENPTVEDLQKQLEGAWLEGFDPTGCKLFQPEGVLGTKKWIGVTEIWALLSSSGLVCKIVDFEVQVGSAAGDRVLQWLSQYFFEEAVPEQDICESRGWGLAWVAAEGTKPPVHLQHHSHSRMVVGCTKINDELFLILFDPAKHHEIVVDPMVNCLELLLVSAADLNVNDQYQLVHVLPNLPPGPLSESEKASIKDPNRNLYKH